MLLSYTIGAEPRDRPGNPSHEAVVERARPEVPGPTTPEPLKSGRIAPIFTFGQRSGPGRERNRRKWISGMYRVWLTTCDQNFKKGELRRITMVPPKTDPKWTKLISNLDKFRVTQLVTRMFFVQLKLITTWGESAENKQKALNLAYDFFTKNETYVKDDIKLIFG
jgi:hypothetical protein